jgi:hypothetical protein
MPLNNATVLDRKSGGSLVEGPAVSFPRYSHNPLKARFLSCG